MSTTLRAAVDANQEPATIANLVRVQALATLALAEEQRLTNLILIWQDPSLAPSGAAHGEFRTTVRSQILEALRA